ncbi:hypothetical protein BT67DRAFT_287867 [Trichocladium antarcticum]|uniref:Uncharacterized protein n=1 Tax=Trichocladium antarcticum TaxID=1450529 RepID=A0AAN6ZEX2_9PEZI|nr:hypothetical protein BT67DRAFT_287867 [Trichocladium antarcticum]
MYILTCTDAEQYQNKPKKPMPSRICGASPESGWVCRIKTRCGRGPRGGWRLRRRYWRRRCRASLRLRPTPLTPRPGQVRPSIHPSIHPSTPSPHVQNEPALQEGCCMYRRSHCDCVVCCVLRKHARRPGPSPSPPLPLLSPSLPSTPPRNRRRGGGGGGGGGGGDGKCVGCDVVNCAHGVAAALGRRGLSLSPCVMEGLRLMLLWGGLSLIGTGRGQTGACGWWWEGGRKTPAWPGPPFFTHTM